MRGVSAWTLWRSGTSVSAFANACSCGRSDRTGSEAPTSHRWCDACVVRSADAARRSAPVPGGDRTELGGGRCSVIAVSLSLSRRALKARSCGGWCGPAGAAGWSAPVPGGDRTELGGGGVRHRGVPFEAGAQGPKLWGGGAVQRMQRAWSAPVPGGDRIELGGGGVRHRGVPFEAGAQARSCGGWCGPAGAADWSDPVPGRERTDLGVVHGPVPAREPSRPGSCSRSSSRWRPDRAGRRCSS